MSEPKLISPMLDNFIMGDPISDHNGVRCCPAMENNTDNKYIVRIISTPASQTQLDALLLSGAYDSKESAAEYFKDVADSIYSEYETLDRLSQLEGFLPYSACQIVPMEGDETGFDVYLLGTYKRSLAQYFRKESMTHLGALNLGLDLCAALAVCRRIGYLYVDLKPENIYLISDREFRIGDLGFLKLDTLKYTSLPDRYRSQYTAPEITDAFSSLNTTIDVYAVGLILYQAFNDGKLPFTDTVTPGEILPAPAYADYEMAEIIMKACAPDPADRWQDPIEMGQALVSYMQKNGAHDTPIVPAPAIEEQTAEKSEETVAEEEENNIELEHTETETQEPLPGYEEEAGLYEDTNPETDSVAEQNTEDIEVTSATTEAESLEDSEEESNAAQEHPPAQLDESSNEEPVTEESIAEETVSDEIIAEESIFTEDEDGNLTFITDEEDESAPSEEDSEVEYTEVTEEVSDMLNQADDLLSHPTPDPVVAPEPVEIPIPAPIEQEEDLEQEEVEPAKESDPTSQEDISESQEQTFEDSESEADTKTEDTSEEEQKPSSKKSHWLRNLLLTVCGIGILTLGFYYYSHFYLQPVDSIMLQENKDGSITVLVSSPVPEDKLSVVCMDTYGNQQSVPVKDGKAVFTDLAPDSAFTVEVVVNGFHRLTGDISTSFTTPAQTEILQFSAVTGAEDGSVILGFAIDGPDSDRWKITYTNDNGEKIEELFSGHMLTLSGLTIGKEYTFILTPEDDLHYIGNTEVKHIASNIIKASNVAVLGCVNNKLAVSWTVPEGIEVSSWTVRCYNDANYDKTIVSNETNAVFDIPNDAAGYTVDVTAQGMSVSERAYAAPNSITVDNISIAADTPNKLEITWDILSKAEKEWLLMYTVNNGPAQEVICETPGKATISPVIPGVCYNINLQTKDGDPILGGSKEYLTAEATKFTGYAVSADNMDFQMCKTPSNANWDRYDLRKSDYRTEFSVGEKASYLIRMRSEYNTSEDEIVSLFVIYDENGTIVSTTTSTTTWIKMWYKNYCELDIPSIPQTPGKYTIRTYFNGALANTNNFTIIND